MKKRGRWKNDEDLNFWQPASDMFSALLLILMLVILLLGLYLVHVPEHDQVDPWAGDSYVEGGDVHTSTVTPEPTYFFWFPGGGGGGDGGGGGETPHPTYILADSPTVSPSFSPTPTITPTPDIPGGGAAGGGVGEGGGEGAGEGPGEEPDMGLKSAVYVMLVDEETERTVKEANVEFELYGNNRALQVLNVYYPERTSYRFYETTENGTFYLPEKLSLGTYELHELTEPEGYDAAANVVFDLLETYDWSDPLVVEVPVSPSRNFIRVKMVDAETNQGVPGGVFDIIAEENVVTADGTLRYRAGQVVGEIECDEEGNGSSEELYLGAFRLVEKVTPDYYASQQEDIAVEVKKRGRLLPAVNTISCERTKISLSLLDESNPARGVSGAVFSVTGGGEEIEATTNNVGRFILDALEKGVTYQITQTQTSGDFQLLRNGFTVVVGRDGRIEGEPTVDLEAFAHVIRVSIGLTDEFSSVQVPNVNLALFDGSTGAMIRTWTTTGAPLTFTNLSPGSYYVVMGGETESRFEFYVSDQAELQKVNLSTSYTLHYVIYGGVAALALVLLIVLVIVIVRIRRKRKRET